MAPTDVAAASLEGTRSMATTCSAPARTAPITHDMPTPPRPITATDAPAGTTAVLVTAPTPVATQQPMSAAAAGSTPSGIGMAAAAGTTSASASVPIAQYVSTSCPVDRRQRAPPPGIRWRKDGESGHAHGRPEAHARQTPHGTSHDRATGWPIASPSTPGPRASMMPAPSWPSTIGPGRSHSPSRTWRSEWQTPEASIRTRTSPGPGSASSRSSIRLGVPGRSSTAARVIGFGG